jgi:2-methylcitrate dehydratase PrpD
VGLPFKTENGRVVGYSDRGGGSHSMAWAGVGAATSIARLGVEKTTHAMGIAGANTPLPSLRDWADLVDLPMFKVADAGWVSQMTIAATLLAAGGSTGYSRYLDGNVGFWRFFGSDSLDFEALFGGLARDWRILDTTYKPWPSCRWIHYPLTAFLSLKHKHGLRGDEIEKIVVRANPFSVSPRFRVQQPNSIINAEFSHAHSLAMAAFDVPAGPLWYSPGNLDAPHVRRFRSVVTVELEPLSANLGQWLEGGQFRRLPAGVDVHARGEVYSETVDMAGGDPWSEATRFTDRMLREKFRNMVVSGKAARSEKSEARAERIIQVVDRLETLDSIGEFTECLASPE